MPQIDFEARRAWFVEHLARLIRAGAVTICAADGPGTLLGFITIAPATGEVDQLCVAPSAQGRGVAQALMARARDLSPSGLSLSVNQDNPRALRFYERQGFVRTGEGVNARSGLPTYALRWTPIPQP
jgi:putative acetyltransferase